MSPAQEVDLSNERLVAYIDGEMSQSEQELVSESLMHNEEARERLDMLKRGGRPFGDAFNILLNAAPEAQLQSMFQELLGKRDAGQLPRSEPETAPPATTAEQPEPTSTAIGDQGAADEKVVPLKPRRSGGTPFWQMAAAAAILVFVFAGGMVTGDLLKQPQQVAEEEVGWREAAARYVALFSQETLAGMPEDPQQRQANLERIQTALGLQLSNDRISNPELSFQGSQLLQMKDQPLAQISYLHNGQTPVALCIIRTNNPAAGPAQETRHGLNVIHWVAGGYGYMVIGNVPDPELRRISDTFRARFS